MAEERFIPHNLPWKEVGRVKHCVIENLPVIGTEDDAPEAYVGGCYVEYILRAVNGHEALVEALGEMLNRFYPHTCDRGPMCAKCGALRAAQSVFNLAEKGSES